MATDELVRDPDEIERLRRQGMYAGATSGNITGSFPAPRAAEDPNIQAAPLRAPEITGLQPIAGKSSSGDLQAPTSGGTDQPKTLPTLSFKERQALPTISAGVPAGSSAYYQNKLERIEDQNRNPYGSAENHPGTLGKIAHVAAKIGNIAGDTFLPHTMALIPGTELHRQLEEQDTQKELGQAQTRESEGALRSAQQRHAQAETEEVEKKVAAKDQTLEKDATGRFVAYHDEKGVHPIDKNAPQEIQDIAANASDKMLPKYETNQATGETVALTYDPKTGKTNAEVVYKGDPKVKTETRDIMRGGKLHAVIFDTTNPLSPGFGKELKDLGETKVPGVDPAEKEGMETVQYRGKDGALHIGALSDAKANGGTGIRKVGPDSEQKARTALVQYDRLIDNAQAASDTMAAWDNPQDKTTAIRIKNQFFSHIPVAGVNPEYVDAFLNSDDMKSLSPQGQEHMQNMLQLYSDAINMMKLETGGVPRGEAFLKTEGAILPQPEKTQAQNRQAISQFEKRIRKDSSEYPRPDDMGPMKGVIPPDASHYLKSKDGGHIIGYVDKDGKDVYW